MNGNPLVARIATAILVGVMAASAGPPPSDEGKSETPMRKIQHHLREWDTCQPEWEAKAEVVVVATYGRGTYPCVFLGGSIASRLRFTFSIESVIKGEVKEPEFDVNLAGVDVRKFPHDFVSGRKYVVFLNPTEKSKAILSGEKLHAGSDPWIRGEEIVAAIDLSKTKLEVDAEKVRASRQGEYAHFQFTFDKWKAMRESESVDLTVQKSFLPFLGNVVLIENMATIAHVRSYLGEPDARYGSDGGICYEYWLNRAAPKTRGVVSGRIELQFGAETILKSARVTFCRYFGRPSAQAGDPSHAPEVPSHPLAAWELKALGLPAGDGESP